MHINALWLSRIQKYKNTPFLIDTSKVIIELKIERQSILLKKYKKMPLEKNIFKASTMQDVFLTEARTARSYWKEFKTLLPQYDFPGRKPHNPDIVNRLLDVGYHHLAGLVSGILDKHDVPAAIGFMHVARTADAKPLVYDLMEMFRADLVEAEVLRFLRLKKKPLVEISGKNIGHFIHEVNERLNRPYFLKDFNRCHTYGYYMGLQILKCLKAVNHNAVFEPLFLPTRHDMRCSLTENDDSAIVLEGPSSTL
ncbi:hypothetical protein BH11PAT3_BH11PAT3_0460 [soil metagenome]